MQRNCWEGSNLSIPLQYDFPSAWLNRNPYFWVTDFTACGIPFLLLRTVQKQ